MWLVTHIAVFNVICVYANNICRAKHLNQRNVTI